MSVWANTGSQSGEGAERHKSGGESSRRTKMTVPGLLNKKLAGEKISAITAYDFASSRLADAAGLDVVLVGDSLAMVMLGHESTLAVTLDEMLIFTRAVRRGLRNALLVADMPFGSYQVDDREAVRNAIRFVKEGGAEAVKLEGGFACADLVRRLADAEIPVMGHVGLTPQALHRMGGYKVQARSAESIDRISEEVDLLTAAGCFSIVLEGIPREVAATLTASSPVPTIGIGAGPDCDGQILVWHDLLGLSLRDKDNPPAKFVRTYLEAGSLIQEALERFRDDVQAGVFPADNESYHLSRETRSAWEESSFKDGSAQMERTT